MLGVAGIAEDGARVYFVARAAPAAAGTNIYGKTAQLGKPNLYAYDSTTGKLAFIATLAEGDEQDWQREFVRPVEVAGEGGQFLLFASSQEDLTPEDETTATQLFEYDATSGELVRVTQGENDYNDNGSGVSTSIELQDFIKDIKSTTNLLNVSSDGKTVVFETGGQLSPFATAAQAGCPSIYEFHSSGTISAGSVHLVSDGSDTQPKSGLCGAQLQGMDGSGANILFTTADPLLSSDVDGVQRAL